MKVAVLGAGMVGSAIAWDLAGEFEVTSFDADEPALSRVSARNPSINTIRVDLSRYDQYSEWLSPFDIAVTAVPGFMGYRTLEAVIRAGKPVADISFFPEDALALDGLAKEKSVVVITDIGVAPGMSNLILGYHDAQMPVSRFECYVGGLPRIRKKPFEYKAPFSPVDVIEEYTRPARLKENGAIVVKPALSEREWMHFEGIGTLEAFNTDGLRSLLHTMPHIPDMKEKTLRYPGHIDIIIALREAGFFEETPLAIDGHLISPLRFTSRILFHDWKLHPGEEELTIMRVMVEGGVAGHAERVEYTLLDRFDPVSQITSMSRTTGYTCTAAVHLIARRLFAETGVSPPERVGRHSACFEFVLSHLRDRGVVWHKKNHPVPV